VFSPDERFLATACGDGKARIWSTASGALDKDQAVRGAAEARAVTPTTTPAIIELGAARSTSPRRTETESLEIVVVSGVVLRVADTIDPARVAGWAN
jgi:WD40 repeat protein